MKDEAINLGLSNEAFIYREKAEPMVKKLLEENFLYDFKFGQITLGSKAVKVDNIKVYEQPYKRPVDEIILDLTFEYNGDAQVEIWLMGVASSVKDLTINDASIRVYFRPLIESQPIIGGMAMSLLREPKIDFDLGGLANLLDFPGIKTLVHNAVDDAVVSAMNPDSMMHIDFTQGKVPPPEFEMIPSLRVRVMSASNLKENFWPHDTNVEPYAVVCYGGEERKTRVVSGNRPDWNETFEFAVKAGVAPEIKIALYDKDTITKDDFLGECRIDAKDVVEQRMDLHMTVDLEKVDSGNVTVEITFVEIKTKVEDVESKRTVCEEMADNDSEDEGSEMMIILEIFIESCNLILDDTKEIPQSVFVSMTPPKGKMQETKAVPGPSPRFREHRAFLFHEIYPREVLEMKVMDKSDASKTLGKYSLDLNSLKNSDDGKLDLRSRSLSPADSGQISFSAKMSNFDYNIKRGYTRWMSEKASNLAGSSVRLAENAAKNIGLATARSVGESFKSISKSPGLARRRIVGTAAVRTEEEKQKRPLETNLDEE